MVPLDSGAALKLTNALWYTPSGRSIDRPHRAAGETRVSADTAHPRYTTEHGRTVVGGGGIAPDVIAGDSTVPVNERRWVVAVGARLLPFREALSAAADAIAKRGEVKRADFTVTAAMRDALWQAMVKRALIVPRDIYDDAHEAIDRVLGRELARQLFGPAGEQLRVVRLDPVVAAASRLLSGVAEPAALIARAAQNNAAVKPDSAR